MNKASLLASAAATLLVGVPAFAQTGGPFADVPTDHWAYAAVDKLQKQGIVIGYPDGTYGGKKAMTRYEFAIAISRLLDKIPQPIATDQFATKADLDRYALKSDLAGLAKQADLDALRRLVNEFQTELTTLGVDLDAVKKRLDALEGRVNAIENELKRVRIGGELNLMARGNHRNKTDRYGRTLLSVLDNNGFQVTSSESGSILSDFRVLHDLDLNVKARLSETATADVVVNFGNYLSFLNSFASFTGARSDRAAGNGLPALVSSQNQEVTIYKAVVEAPIRLPGVGGVNLSAGRMPTQFTPYTLKLLDTDYYFYNSKTDLGDVLVDGAKGNFKIGPVQATAFAGKADPIKFQSNSNGKIEGDAGYGLYAGAGFGAYRPAGFQGVPGGVPTNVQAGLTGGSTATIQQRRPAQSPINPAVNGAMAVENIAGARLTFGASKLGTIGGTFIGMGGSSSFAPVNTNLPNGTTQAVRNLVNAQDRASFNRVYVYGADVNTNLAGIGVNASYTVSDTAGDRLNDGDSHRKITDDNEAYDVALNYTFGNLGLSGGYRRIEPYFAAPGFWTRVGSYYNPVDIKGGYFDVKYAFGGNITFNGAGQFYEGTGDAFADGGLSTSDKINNFRVGLKYGLTSVSGVDLGFERTEYKTLNIAGTRRTTFEDFVNIGYGYAFNPATSFKVLYQIVNYDDRNSGFDTLNGRGGVAAAQFSVKF